MDMNISIRLILIACLSFVVLSCSLLGWGDPPTYEFTAQTVPADGGSVSIDSASYEESDSVKVEATANDAEDYIFDNWSGDISSDENPLEFEITEDTEVAANFRQVSSRYEAELAIEDEANSMLLKFGQDTSSTDEFDEGSDKESPPPPPDGSLHGYFNTGDKDLLYDFRRDKELNVTWDVQYQIGSGNTLVLSWDIDSTSFEGDLVLTSEEDSLSVDMTSTSSAMISSTTEGSFTIEYRVDG